MLELEKLTRTGLIERFVGCSGGRILPERSVKKEGDFKIEPVGYTY